jgi:hypothetical protein
MLVIAQHTISNPDAFWAAAEESTKNLPDTLKVLGVYPAKDGKSGTCLWDGQSAEEVQVFLDKNAGQFATNFCYEINIEKAVGLPVTPLAKAQLS